ncbi:MAG: hypothetical protein U0Y82_03810 [Thermoleophilia bacterium]
MTDESPRRRAPGDGWTLGASGLPKPVWGGMAVILAVLGVVLMATGYSGYGVLMLVLAAAAAVNLW